MGRFWKKDGVLWAVYALAALLVSIQKLTQGPNDAGYTSYENYVIFRNAFTHLLAGLNPYASFPAEQWDLFKYSPAFALAMAPFSVLPDALGLPLWNGLNALVLLAAILGLPGLEAHKRRFFAWFVLLELITSMQNSQSNGLTAAFLLFAYAACERRRPGRAALWAAAGAFLKIFGIFAAAFAAGHRGKGRFALALTGWSLAMAAAPFAVLPSEQVVQIYRWWWELLTLDHAVSTGLSVSGWLQSWFGWSPPKTGVTLAGLILLALSTWAVERRAAQPEGENLRRWLCASVLIWVVIFNHKAESPTYVIALSGVALWYVSYSNPAHWQTVLLWTSFALVSLTPTDLCPRVWREQLVQPYVLKAVPCLVVWAILTFNLLRTLFAMPLRRDMNEAYEP